MSSGSDNQTDHLSPNMQLLVRVFCGLMALSAAFIFTSYLLNSTAMTSIDFDRELVLLRVFSILKDHSAGTQIFNICYLLAAVSGSLACLLAFLLSVLGNNHSKSLYLVGALSIGALSMSYIFFYRPFHVEEISNIISVTDVLSLGLLGLALWLWLNFMVMFPVRVPLATYQHFTAVKKPLPRFTLIPKKWQKKAAQIDEKIQSFSMGKSGGVSKSQLSFFKHLYQGIISPKGALMLSLLFAVVGLFSIADAKQNAWISELSSIIILVITLLVVMGLEKIKVVYFMLDDQARKKVSWIYLGLLYTTLILATSFISGLLFILFGIYETGGFFLQLVFALAAPLFWLVIIIALFFSIFYHGSIDPRMVIKKSSVFGFIGLVLTTLFVALEGTLQSHAILQFGLHDQTGAIITGTMAAVLFGPVRNKVEDKVESFIDRILPVSALSEGKRRTSAIVFNDISGYTAISEQDENAAFMLVSVIHQVGTKAALEYKGRVVKTIGDAIMMEIPSVEGALAAAKKLHKNYTQLSKQYNLPKMPIHTGIHWGEVVRAIDGDIYGKNVNLAARLEGVAGPAEIVLSGAAFEQISHDEDQAGGFKPLGDIELKNIDQPVNCFSYSTQSSQLHEH